MCLLEPLIWSVADEAATALLGRALAAALHPGDVIALNGQLGAGKTRLVQVIAGALGYHDQMVNSPTFVLIQEYDGPLPIYHVDAYRLSGSDEFLDIGGEEVLHGDRACLIEWADRIADVLPRDHLRIDITPTGETSRQIVLTAGGERSAELLKAVTRGPAPSATDTPAPPR
jgi:tRNA threonylcarbamoyladenosine biosynthesis protein TsaE